MTRSSDLDPKAVRLQFGRRRQRLIDGEFLLREVERRMFERLDVVRLAPACAVDVGCGLGRGVSQLRQRYPSARVIGVDVAGPLLVQADADHGAGADRSIGTRLRRWFGAVGAVGGAGGRTDAPAAAFVVADAARLPLRDTSVDLLWSNLAWHWFADPIGAAEEFFRVLRPEGLLMFSSFGVDTMRELRALGAPLPVFPDMHDVGDLLGKVGFAAPVMDTERLTVTWSDPDALMRDLRGLGGNALRTRRAGLTGRARRTAWRSALETLRGADGLIAISFEIVHAHAWCPQRKPRRDGLVPVEFVARRPAR